MKSYTPASPGKNTRIKRWILLLLYSLVILFTLSIVRALRDAAVEYLGTGGFSWVVWFLFALFGLGLGIWLIREKVYRSPIRIVILLISAGAYVIIISRLELAVERLHYIQYGLVAILALRVFMLSHRDPGAIILSLLYVFDLGLLDEFVQWILPMRVGEFRDVGINLTAGILALIPALACNLEHLLVRIPERKSVSAILLHGAMTVVFCGVFITFVHGFGHEVTLDSGSRFKSVFSEDEFTEISRMPGATEWRDVSRSPRAVRSESGFFNWLEESLMQWHAYRHATPEAYNYEAWRHMRHRDGLASERYREFREAHEEERILRGFYRSYLDSFDLALADSVFKRYGKISPREPVPYQSPVQELLVTETSVPVFHGIVIICAGIMTIAGILLSRYRR